jgi:competence protein ComEC
VLRLVYGDVSFLFSGDAEKEAESSMLSEELELEATILKVGHHGSRTSSTPSFIEAVNPEVAIIMVEEGNKYGLPDEEAIEALEAIGATVYRTDIDGTIVVWTDGWQYQVTTEWTGGCWPPPTFVDEASTASESEVISH